MRLESAKRVPLQLFADRNGVSLQKLYAWNSVLGSDGTGCSNQFWAGYYYRVGVSADTPLRTEEWTMTEIRQGIVE
jgi:hypothetical protein